MAGNQGGHHSPNPFVLIEADCSDCSSDGEGVETGSDSGSCRSDGTAASGNHLAVLQELQAREGSKHLAELKRNLRLTPGAVEERDGSSPLCSAASTPTPQRRVQRRLFSSAHDSPRHSDEVDRGVVRFAPTEVPCQVRGRSGRASGGNKENHGAPRHSRERALRWFRKVMPLQFPCLTRQFASDRSTTPSWVVAAFGSQNALYQASILQLKGQCESLIASWFDTGRTLALYLLVFHTGKSRLTVQNLFHKLLCIPSSLLLCDPPKITDPAVAVFWYKKTWCASTAVHGELPDWIKSQALVGASVDAARFKMADMVQWAYDNGFHDESKIAYYYAQLATTDPNAAAWLASPSQAKWVKDCATMVRHYRRAEALAPSMSGYLHARCQNGPGGNALNVTNFLKHQGIFPPRFVDAMRLWLKGLPKKNCIVLHGPPNTGKSMFAYSLNAFLGGRVLSFHNARSQFWLSPLADARAALLDDATDSVWQYIDRYLRNCLDGYPVCIDQKHRLPVEIKAPPLLITTNLDIELNPRYFYLRSRCVFFSFPNEVIQEGGQCCLTLTSSDWRTFVSRLWSRLDLSDQEDEGDAGPSGGAPT